MRGRPRRRAAVGILAVLAGLLAGCSGLPTAGPVEPEEGVLAQDPPPPIGIIAASPPPGADEVRIVQGFVVATGSYAPGFTVARSYLTPSAATQWDPSAQIQVYDSASASAFERTAPGEVTARLPLVGTVTAQGTYEAAADGTVVEQVMALEQVDGEWRIARPPTGLLVSAFDFAREFRTFDTWFPDPSGEVLVPDEVVLPLRGIQTTLLVQALLDGPSAWLAPAVRTAFPEGTSLAVRAVEVEDGTARVSLSEEARAAEGPERSRMAAQLALTLQQVSGVEQVRLEVGGSALVIPGAEDGVVTLAFARSYDPSPPSPAGTVYAVRDGAVVSLLQDGTAPVGGPLGQAAVRAQSVAVARDSGRAAIVDETGRELYAAGFLDEDQIAPLGGGTNLSAPTWDRGGLLWVADRTTVGSRLLVSDGTRMDEVGGVSLADARIESLRMAPDGVRLLLTLSRSGRTEVAVGLVRRPDEGPRTVGIQLLSLRTVPLALAGVLDAAWSGTQQLEVLGVSAATGTEPYGVRLSGAGLVGRGASPGATSLAVAPGDELVLGTDDGRLLRRNTLRQWVSVGEGRRPAYPG